MESILLILLSMQASSFIISVLGYIDPGTGSLILQALVASIVGVSIAAKLFWHSILKFFGVRKSNDTELPEKQDDTEK